MVVKIAKEVKKASGQALLVGGSVRDALLGQYEIKDFDLEVYGLEKSTLKRLLIHVGRGGRSGRLGRQGRVVEIGKQFGVFNLDGIDIALPRTDSRTKPGLGRKPEVKSQPNLEFEQASRRRDLTINALAYDPLTGKILDAQGGLQDLKRGILRAVDRTSFGDDPLRVLRVMQFAGRFGFKIDPQTLRLCRSISLKHLAKERVGEEWRKMMLKSPKPSLGLETGRQLGVFDKLHPALARMSPTNWKATKKAVDKLAVVVSRQSSVDSQLMFATLVHRMRSDADRKFLQQINLSKSQAKVVDKLNELAHQAGKSDKLVRCSVYELSKIGLTVNDLALLLRATGKAALGKEILRRVKVLHAESVKPLLQGKDLLALGVKPGKEMGELLDQVFDQQLAGKFDDVRHRPQKRLAVEWVKQKYNLSS